MVFKMGLDNCCLLCYSIAVTVVAALYVFFDVNYFLRIGFTIGWGRLFEKKKKVADGTQIYGICTSQDVDIFFKHMNNARYLRELDFARFHFYDRTGIYEEIKKNKGHVLQTATNIRYRRTIPWFNTYKVITKVLFGLDFLERWIFWLQFLQYFFYSFLSVVIILSSLYRVVQNCPTILLWMIVNPIIKIVYWDEKTLYIEQQFVTLHDGFIRALVLSKQSTIGLNVPELMAKLTGCDVSYRPTPPSELQDWLTSMEKSSNRLRKKD